MVNEIFFVHREIDDTILAFVIKIYRVYRYLQRED